MHQKNTQAQPPASPLARPIENIYRLACAGIAEGREVSRSRVRANQHDVDNDLVRDMEIVIRWETAARNHLHQIGYTTKRLVEISVEESLRILLESAERDRRTASIATTSAQHTVPDPDEVL